MTNISYYLLPLIWFQAPYSSPRGPLIRLRLDNNVNPRLALDALEKTGKYSPRLIAKLRRRESCEKNVWEGLPMIIAAILAGNQVGLSEKWMNGVTVTYFLLRCAFSPCVWSKKMTLVYSYIKIDTKPASFIRSVIWWACNFCSITTLVKAGMALNKV